MLMLELLIMVYLLLSDAIETDQTFKVVSSIQEMCIAI